MLSLDSVKKRLSLPSTSWQLCLLASIGGALSALLVVGFTLTTEALQQFYFQEKNNYTSLDALSRFLLPCIGALIIVVVSWFTGYKYLRTGIPFVLHRLKVAHGIIPLRNTINQFIGSAVALASGFSVGREGPAVHLGAAFSSYLGSVLKLPHNSIRTLCACGIAAAISASFNTPLAAVIFVMEVILREYKVHIFIPIMMASIVGSMITSSTLGPAHEFEYISTIALTFQHYPYLILLGIGLGIIAFIFNRYLVSVIEHSAKFHILSRLLLAAFITGALGYALPEAIEVDISTIDFSLSGQPHLQMLGALLIAKIVMTICAVGLGIPGGVIGPILVIGAIAGSCAAIVIQPLFPELQLSSDFALMGMAGFMAATLNAPLAALLAVVELSNQIEIIVPAMVVIAVSCVVSGQFFRNRSLFVMQLEIQNLSYRKPPLEKSLQRIGVLGVMKERLTKIIFTNDTEKIAALNELKNKHFLISHVENPKAENDLYYWLQQDESDTEQITIKEHLLLPLHSQSTLVEAYLLLVKKRKGAVYIYGKDIDDILGIVTFEQIRRFLIEGKIH